MIETPLQFSSGPKNDHLRTHTPSDGTVHRVESLPPGLWPPVNFDGEFDALGVDVRALAPATAEETPRARNSFPDVPEWLAMDADVFGSPVHGGRNFPASPFQEPGRFSSEFQNALDMPSVGVNSERDGRNAHTTNSRRTETSEHSAAASLENTGTGTGNDETLAAGDEYDFDDDASDDESSMRRAMTQSPQYPVLLEAYFKCATVGAEPGSDRVTSAEQRKQKLLEIAKRACQAERGRYEQTVSANANYEALHNMAPGSSSDTNSCSSKSSLWRTGEVPQGIPGGVPGCSGDEPKNAQKNARDAQKSVDKFMRRCVAEMEAYCEDLRATYREAEDACCAFEARVAKLGQMTIGAEDTKDNSAVEGKRKRELSVPNGPRASIRTTGTGLTGVPGTDLYPPGSVSSSDTLRQTLKRKYAASILTLKESFLKKRKPGKLPTTSTEILKSWWKERVIWPYPSEPEKKLLMSQTDLNNTQINNWFINQRKRHWHKLFPQGVVPVTEGEARKALISRFGSMEKAIDVARKA